MTLDKRNTSHEKVSLSFSFYHSLPKPAEEEKKVSERKKENPSIRPRNKRTLSMDIKEKEEIKITREKGRGGEESYKEYGYKEQFTGNRESQSFSN